MLRIMATQKIIGFKKESTPYTAETLTASNYNISAYDVKISPDIESYARSLLRGDYSKDVSISGRRKCVVTFTIDMYPGSAVNVSPTYHGIIECCGYKKITYGSTGIALAPHANYNRVPATIEVAFPEEGATPRQIVIKMHGAMGKVKYDMQQIGQPIKMMFEFTGVLNGITTRQYASLITPTAFDTTLPPAVLACTFSFYGTWQFPNKFTVDSGEKLEPFDNISKAAGIDGVRVVDREMMGEVNPDMVVTDDVNYYTQQINNNTGALSLTIGGAVPMYLTAPAVQIEDSYKPEESEGHIRNPLKIRFTRGAVGNDEFELLQGSKS